jgi:hypothetical protein
MLQGKIIRDGQDYFVKAGSVTVAITSDVHALIAQERTEYEQALAELGVSYKDIVDRYNQIARIVGADGVGRPTA